MEPNDPDLLVSRVGSLMEAEVDGEMVGLHVESGTCYGFNDTAFRIWQLVEQPVPLSRLCATLAEEYDVDPVACEQDVRSLLEDLGSGGLVTLSRP